MSALIAISPAGPKRKAEQGLGVSYVTMAFPAPSETFTSHDVHELRRRGVSVVVHTMRPSHRLEQQLLGERDLADVPITHANLASVLGGVKVALSAPLSSIALLSLILRRCFTQPAQLLRSLLLLPRALEIFGEIRARGSEVVHLCWAHLPSMVGFLVQRELPKVVVSVSFSAYDIDLDYGLTAPVAQRSELLRTLATSNLSEIAERFGVAAGQIAVIPDGIPLEVFTDLSQRRVPGRVVSVGRLDPEKGMLAVLDTFAVVRRTLPHATMQIFGDGPQRGALERRAERLGIAAAVDFVGFQPQDRVAQGLAEAEVFLFMSLTERLPNVVKEALAAGCACVVSNTFGICELIPTEKHGSVVPIGAVEAAAAACLRYLGDPLARAEAAALGKAHACARFALSSSLEAYLVSWGGALAQKAA